MKIIDLYIKNSKRHMLTGIKTIEYKPSKRYQIILGPNGSGKSSIFEVITSLVTNISNMYNKDGGFRITLSLNNRIYVLTGGLELCTGFSFLVDNQELNDGGTMTVQKELVYQHFGITPLISEIMSAKKNFCDFKPQERKDWLTMLDKVDYEVITKRYNEYRIDLRDMKGALKVTMQTTLDRDALLSKIDLDNISTKLKEIIAKKDALISKLNGYGVRNYGEYTDSDLEDSNERMKELLKDVDPENNLNDMQVELSILEYQYALVQDRMKVLEEDKIEALKTESIIKMDVTPVEKLIEEDETLIGELRETNPYEMTLEEIQENKHGFISMAYELKQRISSLPDTMGVNAVDVKKEMNSFRTDMTVLTGRLMELEHSVKHYDSDIVVMCPQCQHSFNPYNNKVEVVAELEMVKSKIIEISKRIEERESLIQIKTLWNKEIALFQSMLEQPTFKPFTFHMYESNDFDTSYKESMINALNNIIDQLNIYNNLKEIFDRLAMNKFKLTEMLATKDKLHKSGLSFDIGEIKREIMVVAEDLNARNSIINSVRIKIQLMEKVKEEVNKSRHIRMDMFNKAHDEQDNLEKSLLKELIKSLTNEENKLNGHLKDNSELLRRVTEEDCRIKHYTNEINDLTILTNSLSPAKGLIGVALRQFLDGFLSNVNRIISEMWNYEVVIKPCKINDNGTMDYKFPVHINGIHALKDVSEGSEGMRDIFNLSFMLVSMELLGMSNYPIFLDEFAVKMDPAHRGNAFKLLASITKHHSNVFMISHYLDFYGGIADMDVSVLSQDNMDIEGMTNVNNVMTIKR